ncbi:hypothetical protein Pcinc_010686 [Petrolisthes cinctipes]|uniref:Uncharacterized protein n=1 Tax=Petrolisthes cinctipes TaxID=88211 RepID=A0AAE1G4T8_PETCI|nr:hypothetical protein Pcinc_010686 [Petrolisthes cinctipes]
MPHFRMTSQLMTLHPLNPDNEPAFRTQRLDNGNHSLAGIQQGSPYNVPARPSTPRPQCIKCAPRHLDDYYMNSPM